MSFSQWCCIIMRCGKFMETHKVLLLDVCSAVSVSAGAMNEREEKHLQSH